MKTVLQAEIYNSWGDPFPPKDVARINEDIKQMFGRGASFIIEESDDGFVIKILKESDG